MNYSEIRYYFDLENYEMAIAKLENAIINNSKNQSLIGYLGLAYFLNKNELEGVEIWFSLILEQENVINDLVKIISMEAQLRLEKRQFHLAQKLYQQVIELEENNPVFYDKLAECLSQNNLFELAIANWEKAIELNPNLLDAYLNKAEVHQKLGEYDQAIITYQKRLKITPHDIDSLYQLGLCYQQNEEIENSINAFQNCLKIDQNYSPASTEIGYILLKKEQIKEAIYYWQKSIKNEEKITQNYSNWIDKLVKDQQNIPIEIINNATFLKALKQSESFAEIVFYLGNLLLTKNQYNFAIKCYRQGLIYNNKSAEIYQNLVISLLAINNIEEAEIYAKQLANINLEKSQVLIIQINKIKQQIIDNQNQILDEEKNILLDNKFKQLITNKEEKINYVNIIKSTIKSPQNFYETALEWATKLNLQTTNYYPIYPENDLNLIPPNTPDKYIHYSFRFSEKITLPNSFVVTIPQGRFWLNKEESKSAVITQENWFIGELSPESPALSPNHPDKHPSQNSILNREFLPSSTYLNGNIVVLSGLLNNIYFHWLFDVLPRINLLKSSPLNWEKIDYFIINNNYNFQKETLTKLGIEESKIINPNSENDLHIQAENLIIPSFPGTIAWMPKWSCKFLKDNFIDQQYLQEKATKRIYIKRNLSTTRRLINEEEIIEFLQTKFNFEAINLESLTVSQQANLLAQSQVVISPHGSGLSNLVFCQEGTKVIEIFSPFYVYPCYWLISNLVNLDYYYLIGETFYSENFDKFLYPDGRSEDIYLDCQKLQKIIAFANFIN